MTASCVLHLILYLHITIIIKMEKKGEEKRGRRRRRMRRKESKIPVLKSPVIQLSFGDWF